MSTALGTYWQSGGWSLLFFAAVLVGVAVNRVEATLRQPPRGRRRRKTPHEEGRTGMGVQSRPVAAVLAGSRSPDAGPCSSAAEKGVGAAPRLGTHSATTD